MDNSVYIYQADLLCESCGEDVIHGLRMAEREQAALDAAEGEAQASGPIDTGDSGDWPQGPYPDGGGESDAPQHCGNCGAFLENPLTSEGLAYVEEALRENANRPPTPAGATNEGAQRAEEHRQESLRTWREFYDIHVCGCGAVGRDQHHKECPEHPDYEEND